MSKNNAKCMEWVERDNKVISPCSHLSYYPLVVASGKDEILYDEDGNEYIDFLASASSLNLGTCNDVVTKAIKEQLEKYTQYCAPYAYNVPTIEYAERLVSVYPGGVPAKVCYGNCGSDANDAAVKFARAYTGRKKIITFINAYHGSTYGSCSLTAVTTRMRAKMGPFLPEVYHFPFFGAGIDDETCEKECVKEMETAFATYLPAEEVAAVIIEPVQGDAGLIAAHPIFMKKLYELCKKHGILFISEEVQQAFYRTGKMFSIEHYGIIPDGIVMGKSIGGSLTLGAFMARAEILDCLPAPAHLFTLAGNALSCAAGKASFDYMQTAEFQNRLKENEVIMLECLTALQEKYPNLAGEIRGIGMSRGLAIDHVDPVTGERTPDGVGTFKILYRAYEKGLVLISLGENVLRIQPPLIIKPENLRKGFQIIDEAMADYLAGDIPDSVMSFRKGW